MPYYDSLLNQRIDPQWKAFSWLTLRALLSSVNDVVARGAGSLVNDRRRRWVAAQREAGVLDEFPDLVIDMRRATRKSFFVVGDTGESDASQYAVVAPLLQQDAEENTLFMLILSDIVYPAGSVNDYVNALYIPYRGYSKPIYAIPGNHDWYDGLEGFMFNFCGAEALPATEIDPASYSIRERLWRLAWRRAAAPKRDALHYYRSERPPWKGKPTSRHQPGSYFAIDLGRLLVVCIDTGVTGEVDSEQGDWLRHISCRPQDKVLLTGKPLYVDNDRHPGAIADYVPPENAPRRPDAKHRFVDEVVRDPEHRYLAAIGGDIHNYQRYEDRRGPSAPFTYLVSGGGGAYLGSTHDISMANPEPGVESSVDLAQRTYPSPAQSLKVYAKLLVPQVYRWVLAVLLFGGGFLAGVVLLTAVSLGWISYRGGVEVYTVLAIGVTLLALVSRRLPLGLGFFALGAEIPLLARLITDGHEWVTFAANRTTAWTVGLLAAVVCLCLLCAVIVREVGDRLPRWVVAVTWSAGAGVVLLVSLFLVKREVGWDRVGDLAIGVLGLPILIGAAYMLDTLLGNFGYPKKDATEPSGVPGLPERPVHRMLGVGKWVPRVRRCRGPVLFVVAAIVAAVFFFWWQWHGPRPPVAALLTVLAIAHVPAFLGFAYYLHRISVNARLWSWFWYAALASATTTVAVLADATWALRYLGAVFCVVVAILALAVAVYLNWGHGFALLLNRGGRGGDLSIDDAEAFLAWHRDGRKGNAKPEKRVRLIGTIVMPSLRRDVRSPLHQFLSEIFEPREAPLYKSFLRVDVLDQKVLIKCYRVDGYDPPPGEMPTAEILETVELELSS